MPLDLTRIRALCFDIDGTLSDTDDAWVYSLSRGLHLARWLFPNQDPKPFSRWVIMGIGSPANFIYAIPDRLHIDAPLEQLSGVVSNALSRLGWGVRPPYFWIIPHVRQALEALAPHYPMAVVSARNAKGTLSFLKQYDLLPFFHSIATSQTCSHTKPYPDQLYWAARQMGLAPEACLMIGDSTVDIRAAKAAGAQAVGVLTGFGSSHELRKAGADLILESAAMLPETLLGLSLPLPALSSEELNLPLSTRVNESQNGVRVRLSNLP